MTEVNGRWWTRLSRFIDSREIVFFPGALLLLILPVVALGMYCWRDAGAPPTPDQTLADPPSGTPTNPHKLNALEPNELRDEQRQAAAQRLYDKGQAAAEGGDFSAGYWDFKECVAYLPDHALCHRELGIAAAQQAGRDPALAREASAALKQYLRLEPSSGDKDRIQSLLAELEAGKPQGDNRWPHSLWGRRFSDPELEKRAQAFAARLVVVTASADASPGDKAAAAAVTKANLLAKKSPEDAVTHLEHFMDTAPRLGPEMQAKVWCALGTYYAPLNPEKAQQAFDIGIEQFRFYPDCHYFRCQLLPPGVKAKESCKLYLALDPRGPYAEDALKRAGPLRPEGKVEPPAKKGE